MIEPGGTTRYGYAAFWALSSEDGPVANDTVTMRYYLVLWLTFLHNAGCVDANLKHSPGAVSLGSAGEFIINLAEKGELPGVERGEHCSIQSVPVEPSKMYEP